MTAQEILIELEKMGDLQTKNTLMKHGAKEPFFGVKVADLKKILKKTKKNHELSLELYATGNSDAMYLAALMADEKQITEAQLNDWVEKAYWYYLSEFAVPWVAGESAFGFKLGLQWITSEKEGVAAAGWGTLAYHAGMHPDQELDLNKYSELLDTVAANIGQAKNRVKYAMNSFVISIGSYIKELTPKALEVSEKIGKVEVTLASTACKVPLAKEYIQKVADSGNAGKKRKSCRC